MIPLLASSLLFFDFNLDKVETHCQSQVDRLSYELTHFDMKIIERQYLIGQMTAYHEIIHYCEEIKEKD